MAKPKNSEVFGDYLEAIDEIGRAVVILMERCPEIAPEMALQIAHNQWNAMAARKHCEVNHPHHDEESY